MKNKVLLLDGGGTQTLPIAESLYKKGHEVHIFFQHKLNYGSVTRYAYKKIQTYSVKNEAEYMPYLKDYIAKNEIDVLIPMSDPTAEFLSKHKESLTALVRYVSPDYETFMKGYDKNLLMNVCREHGFPHPRTFDMQTTEISSIPDSMFPAILKPNLTTGGRGMKILKSREELELVYENNVAEYGQCHLQEYVAPGGQQLKVELFVDEKQNLIASSVMHKIRFYPVSGGSSCFNVTISDDSLVKICHEVLVKISWVGFADFDLIEDPKDGIKKIMEINPRVPACLKSAVDSGIDYGNLIVDASMGRELQHYDYHPGKQCRHLGFDVLWFLKSKDRFRAQPSWFNFLNRNQAFQDFSFGDPLPFIYGSLSNIKKLTSVNFRKSKERTV